MSEDRPDSEGVVDVADSGLTRRQLVRTALAAAGGALAAPMLNLGRCRLEASETARPVEVSTHAVDVVLSTLVIDMLGLFTLDWPKLVRWQDQVGAFDETEFRRLERSGIQIFHPAIETGSHDPFQAALRWAAGWNALATSGDCYVGRVASAGDLTAVAAQGRLGVIIGFQNADHFRSERDVELFFGLGQRVSQLTYNGRNRLGSGCQVAWDRGLTDFGAKIVGEMNRLGMAIDVSHCGERTSLDACALSRQPVLITHANCRALVPAQPRCRSDELIRKMSETGGVMGIAMVRPFVGAGDPSLEDLLDHFDRVRRLVGAEHVGLGSDLDFAAHETRSASARALYAIRGLDPAARVFQIADGLLGRGWRRDELELVLGGNFRRALAAIWPAASAGSTLPVAPAEAAAPNAARDPFCPAPQRRVPVGLVTRSG